MKQDDEGPHGKRPSGNNGSATIPLVDAAPLRFLFENSLFLLGGTVAALAWANLDSESYHALLEAAPADGRWGEEFNLHFLVNDFLMALFFAIAAKEVWESLLPGGALSDARKPV